MDNKIYLPPQFGGSEALSTVKGFENVAPDDLVRIRFKFKFLSCNQTIGRLPFRWITFFVDQFFCVEDSADFWSICTKVEPFKGSLNAVLCLSSTFSRIVMLKNEFEIIYVRTEIRTWDS